MSSSWLESASLHTINYNFLVCKADGGGEREGDGGVKPAHAMLMKWALLSFQIKQQKSLFPRRPLRCFSPGSRWQKQAGCTVSNSTHRSPRRTPAPLLSPRRLLPYLSWKPHRIPSFVSPHKDACVLSAGGNCSLGDGRGWQVWTKQFLSRRSRVHADCFGNYRRWLKAWRRTIRCHVLHLTSKLCVRF